MSQLRRYGSTTSSSAGSAGISVWPRSLAISWTGGFVAVIASTGVFVLTHFVTTGLAADAAVSLTLVGLVCGLLVVCTGRIWGGALVHLVYNASGVTLAVVGTLLG